MADSLHPPVSLYIDLRSRALHYKDDDAGAQVRGLVTDIVYDEGIVTIVCLDDGATSMYTNHGGGIIGAGEHEHVAAVTRRVIELTQLQLDSMTLTQDEAAPPIGKRTPVE